MICMCGCGDYYRSEYPVRPLPETEEQHPFLLLAEWAPRDHGLIIVQNYDIYYRPAPLSHNEYRVTSNAVPGVVSNGVPDWLYEGKQINHFALSAKV